LTDHSPHGLEGPEAMPDTEKPILPFIPHFLDDFILELEECFFSYLSANQFAIAAHGGYC
jgi:hypothetical protein